MKRVLTVLALVVMLMSLNPIRALDTIIGSVESIDFEKGVMMVSSPEMGKTFKLVVDQTTNLLIDGNFVSINDVKLPSSIKGTARLQTDGSYIGTDIDVIKTEAAVHMVNGSASAIDKSKNTIEITSKTNEKQTVTLDKNTIIYKNNLVAKIDDIKTGDYCSVSCEKIGSTFKARECKSWDPGQQPNDPGAGGGCVGGGCGVGCGCGCGGGGCP